MGKFPEELKGIQNILDNKLGALDRLKRGLDSAGVLGPYLEHMASDFIHILKSSLNENLSFYYTAVPENVSNKPSREEYQRVLIAFKGILNQLNEKQTKILVVYLSRLMTNNPLILGMLLLYALSEI